MGVLEVAGRNPAQEGEGAAGAEDDTGTRCLLPSGDDERLAVGAADHSPAQPFVLMRGRIVTNQRHVATQIDHELHRRGRQHELAVVCGGRALVPPEQRD